MLIQKNHDIELIDYAVQRGKFQVVQERLSEYLDICNCNNYIMTSKGKKEKKKNDDIKLIEYAVSIHFSESSVRFRGIPSKSP